MLDQYHNKLVSDVKALFGDSLETVEAYFPEDDENTQAAGISINTPAALIEIETLDDAAALELGDGRIGVLCTVSVHCVLSTKTNNLQRELWNFAAELMRGMKQHGFGLHDNESGGKPEDINGLPGRFAKGTAGYDSRVVSFNQVVYLGEADAVREWSAERVFWSFAPKIGLAHIEDYQELATKPVLESVND